MKKNKLKITFIMIAVVVAIALFGGFFVFNNGEEKLFAKNTIVGGVDISGLNLAQASEKMNEKIDSQCIEASLTLKYGDDEWFFGGGNFTATSNYNEVLGDVLKDGKSGNFYQNDQGVEVEYIFNGMDNKLEEVFAEIEVEPQNAEIIFKPDTLQNFEIKEHIVGVMVDRDTLTRDLLRKLKNQKSVVVTIPTIDIMPEVLTQDVAKYTKKQSEFSTDYSKSTPARKDNIKLAFSKINGTILNPGQEFSFNETVGERTVENGFKEAKVILAGEYENGVGGGICQASTTLYNAVIRAGIDVTEVKPHSLPASYVPLSLDAMVSWGYSDLKFTNNTDGPMYIKAFTDDNKITVYIFGDTLKENQTITPRAELVKTLPHSGDKVVVDTEGKYQDKIMFKGEYIREKYPQEGYESKAYLDYYEDGKLVQSKEIRHDIYNPKQGLVYEGAETLPEGMTLPANNVSIILPQVV